MSLFVFNNLLARQVWIDVLTIAQEPFLRIDTATGEVSLPGGPTVNLWGSRAVSRLIDHRCRVILIGGTPEDIILHQGNNLPLGRIAGQTAWDIYPDPTEIHITYDATFCHGQGYFFTGPSLQPEPAPREVLLFHELAHAVSLCENFFGRTQPTWQQYEDAALAAENAFREQIGAPLRVGYDGSGPCVEAANLPPPPPPPSGGFGTIKCFVATAAYGSPLAPEVQLLREFRDDVLCRTRAGAAFFERFFERYYRISPLIVSRMEEDPEVRRMVEWAIVTPIVKHLRLVLDFPEAPLEGLAEPWRSFLEGMRGELERWCQAIPLPETFDELPAAAAVKELELFLRFVFRTAEARSAWLDQLERRGALPLAVPEELRASLTEQLVASGRTEEETRRILGRQSEP